MILSVRQWICACPGKPLISIETAGENTGLNVFGCQCCGGIDDGARVQLDERHDYATGRVYEVVYSPLLGTATVKKPGLLVPEVVYEAEDPGAFESAVTRARELAAEQ